LQIAVAVLIGRAHKGLAIPAKAGKTPAEIWPL
jgi:hypothetical protein